MHALVVYESMFGNTQVIARAIADGLGTQGEVDLVEVSAAPTVVDAGVDLVVVGGPTHAFSMSRASTRKDAGDKYGRPLVSTGIGVRDWVETVRCGPSKMPAAAFDTRFANRMAGSAARGAAKRLRRRGFRLFAPAESFIVTGVEGPLRDGEVDRAREWGRHLAATVAPASTTAS
jgi:hypothetical protein